MERKIRFNHRVRFSICAITLLSLVVTSCKSPATEADPAFAQYIESYTSGPISRHSPIRIMLAPGDSPVQEERAAMPSSLFRFNPGIKGSAVMSGPRILEFRPSEARTPGQLKRAVLYLTMVR